MSILWKRVGEVKSGEILADDVYDGRTFVVLLRKGTILDDNNIELLKKRKVLRVPILFGERSEEPSDTLALRVEEKITEYILPDVPTMIDERVYKEALEDVRDIVRKIMELEALDVEKFRNVSNKLVVEIMKKDERIVNLLRKHATGFLYKHLVNTGALAGFIAHEMGMPRHIIAITCRAALLHDIGLSLLKGEESGVEEEKGELKVHPVVGSYLLKKYSDELEREVIDGVLHHHERFDGKGFPIGLKGKRIPVISRILQVADAYDTLTSDIPGYQGMPPYYALKWIVEHAGRIFDPDIVSSFLRITGVYPTGTKVLLTDGRTGVVLGRSEKYLCPIVRVENEDIDLCKRRDIWIEKVIT